MKWLDRLLVRILIGKRAHYFAVVKVNGRDVSLSIQEYISDHEMFSEMEKIIHEEP